LEFVMQSPSVTPMLHAVYALNQFDEMTGFRKDPPTRLKLRRESIWGDVVNVVAPDGEKLPIPLDQQFHIIYIIPESDLQANLERISDRYMGPALRVLVEQYRLLKWTHVQIARLPLIPDNFGIKCFRADNNDLSIRCSMQYDLDESGVKVSLEMLLGGFIFESP
jgi:hypothetical protein